MSLHAEVTLKCDRCGVDEHADIERDDRPEDMVDAEGWAWRGILLNELICPECVDKDPDGD